MKPFLKWVGGKQDLVEQLGIPDEIQGDYVEPFVGGGSVLLHVLATKKVKGKVRVRVEVKFRVRFSTRCGHIAGAHREGQGGFGLPGGGQGLGQNTASSKTLSADASQDFSGLLGRKLIAWVHLVGCVRLLLSFPTS